MSELSINEQVKKAQDKMKKLEYENLLLKLRIFLFEEECDKLTPELLHKFSNIDDFKRYKNLIDKNSELKTDVQEKDFIMQQASTCIEYLKNTYSETELKRKSEMDVIMRYIKALKACKVNLRKKRVNLIMLPPRVRTKIIHLKVQSARKMKEVKKLLALKNFYLKIEDQSLSKLEDDNVKLEIQNQQLKHVIKEQNDLIDSLNKSIALVRANADEYKTKIECSLMKKSN